MRNSKTKRGIFFGLLCAAMLFAPLAAFAAGQTITIDKPITGDVYGNGDSPNGSMPNNGLSTLKDLNENTVKIQSGGAVGGSVYGSYFEDRTTSTIASDNSVTIDGGKVDGEAYGGYVLFSSGFGSGVIDASAKSNDVTFKSGSVGNAIYGGTALNYDAGQAHTVGNTVTITGGTAGGGISGGESSSYGGSADSLNNSVTVTGGTIGNGIVGGGSNSDGGSAESLNNSVTINGGTIGGSISGGGSSGHGDSANSLNNSVTINGGTIGGDVVGGNSFSDVDSAESLNNSVTVTGGTITGSRIYGGYADSDGSGKSGVANGNSVVLSGGDIITGFGHLVFGGYSLVNGYSETGAATGNSVTVSDDLTLSGSGALSVYGGFVGKASGIPEPGTDAFTGNTFNKNSKVLVTAAGNFENVSFDYTGDANITRLDTTPGGSAKKTVNIDTKSNNVNFNGVITGSGNIDKKGSGELTLTDITGLTGTITLSEGAIKNATSDTIDVVVDGMSLQLAPGESTNTNSDDDNNGNGGNGNGGNGNGGGCDAGAGVFALALLPLACAGVKRKEK
ncbi:hypothetical protein FACS1894204_04940 [Synergistales bacterium]|nr:hypothetical protein FACS1894204_04940 [Synergistales bacterium]